MFFCGGGDDGSVLFEDSLLRPRAGAIQRFFPLLWQVCVYWHAAVSVSESAEKHFILSEMSTILFSKGCFEDWILVVLGGEMGSGLWVELR